MKNQASALFGGHRGVKSWQVHSTLCNAIRLHLCPSSPIAFQLLVTHVTRWHLCFPCNCRCDPARVLACNPTYIEFESFPQRLSVLGSSLSHTSMQTGMLSTRRCATTAFTDARPAHGGLGRRARCSATRCSAQQDGHCPQVVLLPLSLHRCCCTCGILSRSRAVTSNSFIRPHSHAESKVRSSHRAALAGKQVGGGAAEVRFQHGRNCSCVCPAELRATGGACKVVLAGYWAVCFRSCIAPHAWLTSNVKSGTWCASFMCFWSTCLSYIYWLSLLLVCRPQFMPRADALLTAGDPVKNARALLRYALPIDNKPVRTIQVPGNYRLHWVSVVTLLRHSLLLHVHMCEVSSISTRVAVLSRSLPTYRGTPQ